MLPLDALPNLTPEAPARVPAGESWATLSALPGAPCDPCRADKLSQFVITNPSTAERRATPAKRRRVRKRQHSTRRKFDPIAQGQLLAMIAVGVSQREAARSLGFCPTTISKAQRRDADFAARLARAAVAAMRSQKWRNLLGRQAGGGS